MQGMESFTIKIMVAAEPYIRLYTFHYIDSFTRKEIFFNSYYPVTSFCTFGTLLLNAKYTNSDNETNPLRRAESLLKSS